MVDPAMLVALSSLGTLAVGVSAAAALKGWDGWLELRRLEAERGRHPGTRPELADLKQRIRRLEAIADGRE